MNTTTPTSISSLPYTRREIKHPKRNRKGYHIFMSIFLKEFLQLNEEEQEESLVDNGIWEKQSAAASMSLLSLPRPLLPDIVRFAAKTWRAMSLNMVRAWKVRAASLNERPIPGNFVRIPTIINMQQDVCKSLTLSWAEFCRLFHKSLSKPPKQYKKKQEW